MKKPNILFVFSDQHRYCDLGCYGNPYVRTPNLDAFAQSGVQMNQFFSNCPVCVPARGTMLTGLYPLKHGAVANDLRIRPDVESLATVLNRGGYNTAYIGKWHLGGIPRNRAIPEEERLGFSEWRVCNCNHDYHHAWYNDTGNVRHTIDGYEPFMQTDLALEYLSSQKDSDQPWALVLSYGPPHEPYELAPPEYQQIYADKALPFRENVKFPAYLSPSRPINEAQLLEWYRGYYAHITALDAQFGRILDCLREQGQDENTIVVYTSDHGDMLGSHGLTNKQWPYEESSHVPFLIRYGNHLKPGKREQLMSLVDIAPTLAGMADLRFLTDIDGHDRKDIFTNEHAQGTDSVYLFEYIPCHQAYDRGSTEWRAIRDARYTYAKTPYDEGWLLFDNLADPMQINNLAGIHSYRQIQEQLDAALNVLIAQYDAFLPWEHLIESFGLQTAWNESQAYFGYPLLP